MEVCCELDPGHGIPGLPHPQLLLPFCLFVFQTQGASGRLIKRELEMGCKDKSVLSAFQGLHTVGLPTPWTYPANYRLADSGKLVACLCGMAVVAF